MRYGFRLVLFAALLLGVAHPVHAEELSGTIRSEGRPVVNLKITVEGRNEQATTDSRGEYKLNLPPGEYVLVMRGGQKRVPVTVKSPSTRQDIQL